MDFFESLGIIPKIEEEGKVYPLSEQASSFLDIFLYELNKRDVVVELNQEVVSIVKKNNQFVVTTSTNQKFSANKVILSSGGKAMPLTGSNGSGYDLVKPMGHQISTVFPALVKLKLDSPYLKQLSGVKINSQVDLLVNEKMVQTEYGDILFTNYGISGPTILSLSRKANEFLALGEKVFIRVILVQSISKQRLINRFEQFEDYPIDQSLIGLVNKRFINVLIRESKIEKANKLVRDIPKEKIFSLINMLFDWQIEVIGSLGFEEAQITAGGIKLDNINPSTLESLKVPGLFFAGEVVDIDGKCGGFNLQWAWSSGYIAGKNAAEAKL
jgi:predicted Rossmann fold flavoprotein